MATAGAPVGAETLLAPVRLSDWIVATSTASSYAPGVVWRSLRERPAQHALVAQLHADIAARTADGEDLAAASAQRLRAWLAGRPVTGRVLLVPPMAAHARQLQPHADPVIPAGDDLELPDRPATVTVLRDDGTRCDLRFRATHRAADYLRRCRLADETSPPPVDQVHVVQPGGQVQRVGVAAWNADAQDAPAPGAWLWAPARASRWPDAASDRMATFLATQGPADAGHHTPLQPTQPPSAPAETPTLPRDLPLSASDWGMTGLLQTPTARTRSAGHVGLTVHRAWPYTQSTVVLSPFDRLEIGVRYTSVSHQLYGPDIAGDQSYKDKSSEIRWRLWEENAWRPALAMGLRDPGGTGLFAGEYLVGNKRIGDLDLSLGLGWGYLGARGSMGNPLARLGLRSAQRVQGAVGAGGTAHLSSLFTGRTALFGGLQWHTPWAPLQVKLEWDGNDYRHEPFGHDLQARSPLNLGLHWQNGPLHLNVSVERGRQWAAGVSFETPLERIGVTRTDSRPRTPVAPTAPAAPPAPGTALLDALSQDTGWTATRLQTGSEWVVEFDPAHGVQVQPRIERAIARLHQVAPASVQRFRLVRSSHEQPMVQTVVDRAAWVEERTQWLPPTQRRHTLVTAEADSGTEPDASSDRVAPLPTPTRHSVHLGYQQHLGGPDGYLYALTLRASAQARLWPGGWVQGSVSARLSDNYDRFAYTAPSGLPRVRTHLREYLTTARVTVPNLQLTHLHRLGDSVFGLAYAGLLESMFAGAGAEVLWRPLDSRWAVGVDLNRVQPRGFDQRLGLRGAALTTGHLSLHWDTGWHGVQASTAVGQYLAGDRGATLDLSRVFDNGTRIGAWLTRTNVSAAQFGEGSFDKGLYIAIPFDAFVSAWSGQSAVLAWQPLIRDGGARLQRQHTLWGLTQARDRQALRYRSAVVDD